MSNYIEYNDKIAFHPGYYLEEMVKESGLTQADFAKRLGTTPKNLSILIRGEQNLSIDIAFKLSRLSGTTIDYWLNLQLAYNAMQAEFLSDKELKKEKEVFKCLDYKYFRDYFGLPDLPKKVNEQIKYVREFLKISSLTVLQHENLTVNFRSYSKNLSQSNIINANTMVQIAINLALKIESPLFNKKKFQDSIEFALTQTRNHQGFLPIIQKSFLESGVILIVLPSLKNSGINGATKKLHGRILLMVNDRRHFADTFWFTLFHEIGHIINDDYGITFKDNTNIAENKADIYAQEKLIPQKPYDTFIKCNTSFNETCIKAFADSINRDPGIVLGRLQNDGKLSFAETTLSDKLRHKYKISPI